MELRYCDHCGKVLKAEGRSEEINPAEHFLCSQCKAHGAKASRTKVEKKPPGSLDFLSNPLEAGKLNLFSNATVVRTKEKMKKEGSGLLGLRIEEQPLIDSLCDDSKGSSAPAKSAKKIQFRCFQCRTVLEIRPVKGPSRIICPTCKLNLFVDDTGLISKTPPSAAKPPPPGKPAGDQPPESNVLRKGLRKSAHPEPIKLQFKCLHCRVVLRVQAVQKSSRMVCPKCKGNLFLDPAGLVSKHPPRISEAAKPRSQSPATVKERLPAEPPAERTVPPGEGLEKKAAPPPPKRKRARKRKRNASNLVRVSTFLPRDVVEEIEESGEAKSKVIREIIQEKVRSPAREADPRDPS